MPLEQWVAYKKEYGKSYTPEEDAKRYQIFEENLVVVEEHNKRYDRGEVKYTKGLNQFSDWIPFTWAEIGGSSETSSIKAADLPIPTERHLSVSSAITYEETIRPRHQVANYSSAPEDSEVSLQSSFDVEMEIRNYKSRQEMVQLSVQMMSNSNPPYYKVQKPPVPKKPKRVAPQPATFHLGMGHMKKRAEYET